MEPRETVQRALACVDETLEGIAAALRRGKPEDLVRYLRFWGGFHTYSFSNVALLLSQDPGATRVAGYQQWKRVGRHVRKGAKGLAILYPRLRVREDPDSGRGRPTLCGFGVGHVFDVASTDGAPLPEPPAWRARGPARAGDVERIAEGIRRAGIGVGFGREAVERRVRGADGVTYRDGSRVVIAVRDDFEPAHTVHTLLHEFAHAVLHFGPEGEARRGRRELEADATAAAVASALGYDFQDATYRYLAQWDATADALAESLPSIGRAVRIMLGELGVLGDPTPAPGRSPGLE